MLRTLVESEHYAQCCKNIEPDAPRLDEALRYPLYAIAEKPEEFPEVPGTRLRRVRTNDFPGAPALLIFFAIQNDNECLLVSLEKLPGDPELSASADD
jgi:hypothetical protein